MSEKDDLKLDTPEQFIDKVDEFAQCWFSKEILKNNLNDPKIILSFFKTWLLDLRDQEAAEDFRKMERGF